MSRSLVLALVGFGIVCGVLLGSARLKPYLRERAIERKERQERASVAKKIAKEMREEAQLSTPLGREEQVRNMLYLPKGEKLLQNPSP